MRTLGLAAAPLLSELLESDLPGRRLSATVILQMTPRPEYLDWLTNRFRIEKPFIAYHAAIALEVASRVFGKDQQEKLKQAIQLAKEYVGTSKMASDRWNVLNRAEKNLEGAA
jgi:hypothetical protein